MRRFTAILIYLIYLSRNVREVASTTGSASLYSRDRPEAIRGIRAPADNAVPLFRPG